MLRLTHSSGTVPLVTGITTAAVLSGLAIITVAHAGCDNPGAYQPHNGVVELIGGCVAREDLPLVPRPPMPPKQVGVSPALTP